MRPAHRVALDDALGRAGGARGIDDVERRRSGAIVDRGGLGACGREPGVEAPRVSSADLPSRRCALRSAIAAAFSPSTNTIGAPQSAIIAAIDVGRDGRRDRRGDAAGAERAEEDRGIVDRRRGDDRDRLALRDAVALQRRGDAVHQRVELGIVELRRVVGDRDLVAAFARHARGSGRAGWRSRWSSRSAAVVMRRIR